MLSNHDLLQHLEKTYPREVHRVGELIDPRECEHAGYEEALRERGKRPWVIFDQSMRAEVAGAGFGSELGGDVVLDEAEHQACDRGR